MTDEYQQTAIGKIPKDWKVIKAKEVFSFEYGKGLPEKRRVSGKCPVVGSNGVVGYHNQALVSGPGIVVGRKGTIGAISWIESDFWPIDTTYYVKLKKDNVYLKWLFFKLSHLNLERFNLSDVVPGLKRDLVYNMKFSLPTLPEQHRIVEVLSNVDNAIWRADEAIAKTERLKKGLMHKLLTEGIGHKEFKETKIGKIPKDWKVVELRNIVEKESDIVAGPFGSNLKVCDYKPHGVPIIRLQNIERNQFINKDIKYISPEKAEELSYHTYHPGDIVLAKLGDPIGKTCIVPSFMKGGVVVADVVRIRPSPRKAMTLFVEYVLNSSMCFYQLKRQTIGSTRPRVNISQVRNLRIPLPTLDEQQRIADILSTVDYKLELDMNRKKKLERIKKGLMNDLLSGKVRVKVD